MLVGQQPYISPKIERMIKEIVRDNARHERELRSTHRERLVCPVETKFLENEETLSVFSRNISSAGIALITPRPFDERFLTKLEIHRLSKGANQVVAECRWCKPFGKNYWVSGWQFIRLLNN